MKTHSDLVKKLLKDPVKVSDTLTIAKANLIHLQMGISGEAGEITDTIKKHVVYNQALDLENLIEELGDLEFYLEGLRQELNLSRLEILEHNITKLSKRYGESYSDLAAKTRADKS